MTKPRPVSLISDAVTTHADALPRATLLELARALRSAEVTVTEGTLSEDVFSEDTIEMPVVFSNTGT